MKRQHAHALLAFAGAFGVLPAPAAVDGLEAARMQSRMSLHWDNLRGPANWVAGALPTRDAASGLFAVDLDGGSEVAIHVPAHALLRVMTLADDAVAPAAALSQGTGLAIELKPVRGTDGRSWLVRTNSPQPSVIHLRAGGGPASSQRFALFLARFEAPPDPVAYRHEVPLPGAQVHVRRADEAVGKDHARVPAGGVLTTTVRGPDRLLFEYRLGAADANRPALATVEVALDGQEVRSVRQPTGAETVAPVQFDSEWRAANRRERVAIDVPPGEHTLVLRPSHTLVVRAAAAREPDLLLPELNLPAQWRGVEPDRVLEEAEQSSIAAAESNQWRDIGRLAAERLLAQARQRPGVRGVQSAADELSGQFSQYQDLPPSTAGTTRIRPFILQQPQPPDEPVRHQIVPTLAALRPEELPAARFHRLGAQSLHFEAPPVRYPLRLRIMVPVTAGRTRMEIRHGDRVVALDNRNPQLDAQKLRLSTPLSSVLTPDGVSLLADPERTTRPLLAPAAVTAVEWQLPPGTRAFTLRSLDGEPEVAVQWAASTEYFLDDEFLAQQLAPDLQAEQPGSQRESALQPFVRMLAAARAQYIANVAPASRRTEGTDEEAARRAAASAAVESEPARAVELWQQALHASEPETRAAALRGLARALFAAGDRFGGERLLRSHWIGSDTALARAAEEELQALYVREQDAAMELLFASAVAAKDPSSYARLSTLLSANGDDRLALLAGVASPTRNVPALLLGALRIGYWQTFDALLAQLPASDERLAWEAQRALRHGQIEQAAALFTSSGALEWAESLRAAREVAPALQPSSGERAGAVAQWLHWQARHPGPHGWQPDLQAVVRHGGGLSLRSTALNLRSQWWKADAAQPLVARLVGPARVRIEARPLHATPGSVADGWLHVRAERQLWVMPFRQNQVSPGLVAENGSGMPGAAITRDIDLPPGLHELRVDAGDVPLAARVLQQRPLLQLPVLPGPTASHFEPQEGFITRTLPAPECGGRSGCVLLAGDDGLTPLTTELEAASWPGLPAPAMAFDPAARRLAAADVDGALAHVTDPRERMRLLLWLAHTDPATRSRVLALGAELANAHPEAEIRSHWEQLSAGSAWVLSPLVDRSAGLRRVESPAGMPESPTGRIRAALLPALRPGELRIGGDSRASFVSEESKGYRLRIEFALEEMPGLPTLPATLQLERNGRPWQTIELTPQARTRWLDLQVPPGAQAISASLRQPYANQFVRVRFEGPVQPELTTTRDWHIATGQEPVRVTVAGPVTVRIDRLDSDGVRSEERLITEQMATLVLPPRAGAAESLFRIYRRLPQPGAARNPPVRPNSYEPQAVPEAPPPWGETAPSSPREVRFIDAQPLTEQRDETLTFRAGLQQRRDSDATGGATTPASDRFAEAGVSWRRGEQDASNWTAADGLLRLPTRGSPVFGARWSTERLVEWSAERPWPFSVQASLESFLQSTPQGLGMSITARTSAEQTRAIGSTLSHTPSIGVLARWLSLKGVDDTSRVDTDVFTRYQATHRQALTASETLSWRPWRDTHLRARLNLVTNPDLNPLRPDQVGGELLLRQLVGGTRVEAGVRVTRYRADSDRGSDTVVRQWRVGTGTDWWLADGSRIELVTQLSRDPAQRALWGGIELRWHWSAGRQLRDFAPSELDFRALRTWQAPITSNRIEERQ